MCEPCPRHGLRRKLSLAAAALGLLLFLSSGIFVTVWLLSNTDRWRVQAVRWASAEMNRDLSIARIRPSFSLRQGLILTLEDIRLANAPGFTFPAQPLAMLTVARAELGVDWRALLARRLVVHSLDIRGANLALAQTADGHRNWQFRDVVAQRGSNDETTPQQAVINAVQRLSIRDSAVTLSLLGLTETVQIERFDARLPVSGDTTLQAAFIHNLVPYEFHFTMSGDSTQTAQAPQVLNLSWQSSRHQAELTVDYLHRANLYQFDHLQARIDGQTVEGTAVIDLRPAQPALQARLTMPVVQIGQLATAEPATANQPATVSAPVFSRQPLPWNLLSLLDADVTIDGQHIQHGEHDLGPLHIGLLLQDGKLATTLLLQPPRTPQPIQVDLQATILRQARLQMRVPTLDPLLWTDLLGVQPWLRSPITGVVDLTGQGATPHDLVASVQGLIELEARAGSLNLAALPPLLRTALETLLGQQKLQQAALGCLKATLPVLQGLIHMGGSKGPADGAIGLDSTILSAAAVGRIDLNAETVALRVVAAPKLAGLEETALPFDIGGNLRDPHLTLDLPAAAGQVAGQVVNKLAEILPTARMGLVAARATGHDLAQFAVPMPANPCLAATPPAPAADNALLPNNPSSWSDTRALLEQLIKAAPPPAAEMPLQ